MFSNCKIIVFLSFLSSKKQQLENNAKDEIPVFLLIVFYGPKINSRM